MKKLLYILSIFAISCGEFEIYDTPYPDSATVNVSVEWTTLHDGDTAPTEFAILNSGTEQRVSAETTYIIDPSSDNSFVVYNLPSGITISGGVAALNEATRAAVDPEVTPEHLYYGVGSTTLSADQVQDIKVSTYRATAPLSINLSYDKDQLSTLKSVVAEISGIATSRNLSTGALLEEGTLTQYPTLDDSGVVALSYNIFGTLGDKQELTLVITSADEQTKSVTIDVTSQLSSFNNNMEPMTIDESMDIKTDFTVTLTPEWATLHSGDVAPTTYTVLYSGAAQEYTTPCTYLLQSTSSTDFLLYNTPSDITITGGVATLDNLATSPEYLYYGSESVTYAIGETENVTLSTSRANAPLTVVLSYDNSEVSGVASIKVELSGVATSRNLLTGELLNSGVLTQTPTFDGSGVITLSYNIFGVVGDKQELSLSITSADNQTKVIPIDLTSKLSNFNANLEPLQITESVSLKTDFTVVLTPEWAILHSGDTTPSAYTVYYDGSTQQYTTPCTYLLQAASSTDFLLYNNPSDITISGGVATLDNLATNPAHLYYGSTSVSYIVGSTESITVATSRATAPLTINLNYDETLLSDIVEVSASLSGIASSRNLTTGALSTEVTLVQSPTLSGSTTALNYTIFGTSGDKQELTVVVKIANGETKTISVDLTSKMANFNTDLEPLTIDETIDIATDYTINLTPEWTALHDGDTAPTEYTVVNNSVAQIYYTTPCQYLLKYNSDADFLVYNNPSGIIVSDGVATLDNLAPNPDHLYCGTKSVIYNIGVTESIAVSTSRATAPLTLKMSYESSEVANISSVEVTLSGVVTSKNLWTGANLSYGILTQTPTISAASSEVEITFNLLGINEGDTQILTFTFTTIDQKTIVVTSDLSSDVASFNDNMSPVSLASDLSLPSDTETSGSINDWNNVNAGDGTAN